MDNPEDDPPMNVVIDFALAHFIEARQNMINGREEYVPKKVQHPVTRQSLDTSVELR